MGVARVNLPMFISKLKNMTTIYFEASDEDDLRKTGFSKDGKHQNSQIFLGLLVGLGGYAIGYEMFFRRNA